MSSFAWLIVLFITLCALVLLVYILVVKSYYWGDKKQAPIPKKTKKPDE